jgi:glycosyltransferase involved in cell wall biosynthesis
LRNASGRRNEAGEKGCRRRRVRPAKIAFVKFSIVTASYNQGRFVRDCVTSVQAQTGVAWEHLVQDAGSTDETHAVLAEFPHLHLTVEKDQGMSDGINRGFRKAAGDWVMWLNTDDYLCPGALAKVAAFAEKNPQADVIYGDVDFVNANRTLLRRMPAIRFDFNVLLFYGCFIQSTATFIRRRVLEAGHLLDLEYRVCMDFEYYVRLARLGYQFRHLPERLAAFRWHETNTSAVLAQRRHQERLRVQREHLRLTGRNALQSGWILWLLFRAYQLKRRAILLTGA